jgi:ketosteroid isomerase-like protein
MDIRDLQSQVDSALLARDSGTLQRLVADDCRIIGPRGFQIDKAQWIGAHEESDYEQVKLESSDVESTTFGDAGIVWDVKMSVCRYHGELIEGLFRVTHVWGRQEDGWRLHSVQYTAISG